jgi:hypothetical protein
VFVAVFILYPELDALMRAWWIHETLVAVFGMVVGIVTTIIIRGLGR